MVCYLDKRLQSAGQRSPCAVPRGVRRAILADQRSDSCLDLRRYAKYLTPELLWELGHTAGDDATDVNLSGWQAMTTVRLCAALKLVHGR